MRIGVVRNYRGLEEINYLLTLEDFKQKFAQETRTDLFSTHDAEEDWAYFTEELQNDGIADWALFNNDTMYVFVLETEQQLAAFLRGDFNEYADPAELVLNNYGGESAGENIVDVINRYIDYGWSFNLQESSADVLEWATSLYPDPVTDKAHHTGFAAVLSKIRGSLNEREIHQCEEYLAHDAA